MLSGSHGHACGILNVNMCIWVLGRDWPLSVYCTIAVLSNVNQSQ